MLAKLTCPECRAEIVPSNSEWHCPKCGRRFSYLHGILSFLTDKEKFNEGEFEEKQKKAWSESAALRQKISRSRFLSALNTFRIKFSFFGRRDRIFYNEMAHGDKSRLILDLGCGGGRHYFCNYGKVIGVDPELELLPLAKKLYAEVYHAGGYQLPFADNTFDYVVSSDVLGHIPFDKKDALFAEMFRVLKPGGRAVHVIETLSIEDRSAAGACLQRRDDERPSPIASERSGACRDARAGEAEDDEIHRRRAEARGFAFRIEISGDHREARRGVGAREPDRLPVHHRVWAVVRFQRRQRLALRDDERGCGRVGTGRGRPRA